jgi:ribosomal protein S18 acetylase RimI-like enzyme
MTEPRIATSTASDRAAIADTLIAAFAADPVLSWAFPDEAARMRHGRRFFAGLARRQVRHGLVWTAGGGAAIWAPPGRWREPPLDAAWIAVTSLPGVWPHPMRVARGLIGIEARHPQTPHMYLATVGVHPDHQGQGLGTRLLAPGLAEADARRLPAYLESSNEKNVPLYERLGFAVTAEVQLVAGPSVWLMWRPPTPPA